MVKQAYNVQQGVMILLSFTATLTRRESLSDEEQFQELQNELEDVQVRLETLERQLRRPRTNLCHCLQS